MDPHVEHLVAVSQRRAVIIVKRKIRLDESGCFLVLLCYGPSAECHTKPQPSQQINSPADIWSTCHGLGITCLVWNLCQMKNNFSAKEMCSAGVSKIRPYVRTLPLNYNNKSSLKVYMYSNNMLCGIRTRTILYLVKVWLICSCDDGLGHV